MTDLKKKAEDLAGNVLSRHVEPQDLPEWIEDAFCEVQAEAYEDAVRITDAVGISPIAILEGIDERDVRAMQSLISAKLKERAAKLRGEE